MVDALIKRGDEVVIIDDLSTGKKENINPKAKFYEKDLLSKNLQHLHSHYERNRRGRNLGAAKHQNR